MNIKLDRRRFMKQALLASSAAVLPLSSIMAGEKVNRPNILWILAEDLGLQLGCYGNKSVRTPNLDRLASEGALFTHAFTNAPVCSPSRSSMMTGMYPTSIGAHNHRTIRELKKELPEGVHVFTKYLKDAGYLSALCGIQKTDWNFVYSAKPYDTKNWDTLKDKQPFFCQYQFYETHRPFHACKEYPVNRDTLKVSPDTVDHKDCREELAQYMETINILDQKVGEVLAKLKRDGLDKNTIVVFSGDNGPHLHRGKRFLYDLGIAMPLIIRSPAHFKPGTVIDELVTALDFAPTFVNLAGGEVPSHMQGRVFFGPGKQPAPEYIFAVRDRCDGDVDRIRCVRSKRYKYIRNFMPEVTGYQSGFKNVEATMLMAKLHESNELPPAQAAYFKPKPAEELYDLKNDPWELNNLVSSDKHKKLLETMRAKLKKWTVATGDQGQIPESEEDLDKYRKYMEKKKEEQRNKAGKSKIKSKVNR